MTFEMKPQEGVSRPLAPLRRGPDSLLLDLQGTMLNVALVSTKYLSLVDSLVRKVNQASVGKCMVVAMVCAAVVAKLTGAQWLASFPTRSKGQGNVWPSVQFVLPAHAIPRVFELLKGGGGRRAISDWASPPLLSSFFHLAGVGLPLCQVMAVATIGSWPPRASYKAPASLTIAMTVLWSPVPTVSLVEGSSQIKKMERKRSQITV